MFVPFLGVPSYTMTLVYSLIKKTQCRVVLGYALRTNSGFKVIFKQVDTKIYSEKSKGERAEGLVVETKATLLHFIGIKPFYYYLCLPCR